MTATAERRTTRELRLRYQSTGTWTDIQSEVHRVASRLPDGRVLSMTDEYGRHVRDSPHRDEERNWLIQTFTITLRYTHCSTAAEAIDDGEMTAATLGLTGEVVDINDAGESLPGYPRS